jgi:glyoxylase-like metal-dependent hydrolase (beta-lactamase superfamily II)
MTLLSRPDGNLLKRHRSGVLLLLALAAGCAQQEAPDATAPAEPPATVEATGPVREITNVVGDLYRARNNNHYTVFLITTDGVVLGDPIDTGFAEWLKSEIANRFNATVSHVVYSHHHWDHASGGAVFADTATFIGHENMAAALEALLPSNAAPLDTDGDGLVSRAEATGGYAGSFDFLDRDGDGSLTGSEINAEIHPPGTTYADAMTLEVGGSTVELVHPGPAHSDDMTVLAFPKERAAFAVDFINVRRFPGSLAGTTFDEYAAAIGMIQALDIDIVLPGHGDAGVRDDLAEYAMFLDDVRARVADGLAEGLPLDQLQNTVILEPYVEWLLYDDRRANLVSEAYTILTAP